MTTDCKFCETDIAVAKATSRSGGAIGKNAVVPKKVRELLLPNDTVLDYGCGKHSEHVKQFLQEGVNCVGYDFHCDNAAVLQDKYAIVYLSNVLNVQNSEGSLRATVAEAWSCVSRLMVANFPVSPRKDAFASLRSSEAVYFITNILKEITQRSPTNIGTLAAPIFVILR